MEEIKLCDYGCGKPATKQFKNGKFCCKETYKSCSAITKKTTNKITGYKPKIISFENKDNILCEYGCGRKSEYIIEFKHSKKYCCSKNYSKCKSNINSWNKGLTKFIDKRVENNSKSKIGKKYKKLNYYLKHWNSILEVEFLEEEPNSKELIVKCKECGEKFKPRKREIENRFCKIRNNELDKGCFYCYHCKEKRKYKNHDYFNYYNLVLAETEKSVRKNNHQIKNIELRGIKFGYDLDHKFSIREGFKNNIIPYVISHWKNLEILKVKDNRKKSKKCSITIEKLFEEISKETNS